MCTMHRILKKNNASVLFASFFLLVRKDLFNMISKLTYEEQEGSGNRSFR